MVDTIHRDKEIDKEVIFQAIEAMYLSSVKKKLGESEEIRVTIDRENGELQIFEGEVEVEVEDLGRIAASTGKQVFFQRIREAERDVIFDEYSTKVGKLVSGVVQRSEGPNLIVSLGKVEGFLPRSEQVPGERFRVGERIKVLVLDLKKNAHRVRIILSRSSPEIVRSLFELEVPEIADKTIEIMGIAREPGYRTKIAVTTYDHNVDCVGACVGVRGSRIKNIVDELFGEKIDIVRWNESIEVLIMNGLKPAEISSMDLDFDQKRATVYVKSDQQSIAIGKRGQNVRLASKLSEWDIDIVMVSDEELENLRNEVLNEEGLLDNSENSTDGEATDESADAETATNEVVSEDESSADTENAEEDSEDTDDSDDETENTESDTRLDAAGEAEASAEDTEDTEDTEVTEDAEGEIETDGSDEPEDEVDADEELDRLPGEGEADANSLDISDITDTDTAVDSEKQQDNQV